MRYSKATTVTPSDTADIAPGSVPYDGLFIGVTGNIVIVLEDNSTITMTSVAANTVWPFALKRVNATGTTASGIKALRF